MTRSGVTDPDTQPWGSSTAPSGNRTSLLCAPASESSRETASPTTPEVLTGVFGSPGRCTGGQASPRVTSDVVTAGDAKQQVAHRHGFHCREGDGWMAAQRAEVLHIHQLLLFLQLQVQDLSSKPSLLPSAVLGQGTPQQGLARHTLGAVGTGSGAQSHTSCCH